jgi:regulatory protein
MKITSLEPQKKSKNRLNLYVDDVFKAGIDAGTAASLGLFVGKEIDESTLSELADEESYQLCLDKAFLLLAIRMQTEHELWEKLGKRSLKKDIGRAIARLKELGYVDDFKFANLWAESRSHNHGVNTLRTELIKKGLKKEVIDEALAKISPEQQLEAAKKIIRDKDR